MKKNTTPSGEVGIISEFLKLNKTQPPNLKQTIIYQLIEENRRQFPLEPERDDLIDMELLAVAVRQERNSQFLDN